MWNRFLCSQEKANAGENENEITNQLLGSRGNLLPNKLPLRKFNYAQVKWRSRGVTPAQSPRGAHNGTKTGREMKNLRPLSTLTLVDSLEGQRNFLQSTFFIAWKSSTSRYCTMCQLCSWHNIMGTYLYLFFLE